jgi:hypothetical protein
MEQAPSKKAAGQHSANSEQSDSGTNTHRPSWHKFMLSGEPKVSRKCELTVCMAGRMGVYSYTAL